MGETEGKEREELVKGIDFKMEDKITALVIAGVKEGKADDDIKHDIFSKGVPFSKLGKLYNAILKANDLVVDVKTVKNAIDELLNKCEFNFDETWEHLKNVSDQVVKEVPDSTQSRVFAQMRKLFKENEAQMPRKAATKRGRMGVVNKTLIDVFHADPKATQNDLTEALSKVVKSEKVALDYTKSNYAVCYAIANGLSALEVLTELAKAKEDAKTDPTEVDDPTDPTDPAEKVAE